MNINDIYGGKYLKAADLQGRAVRVVIAGASLQALPTGQSKIALKFTKGDKLMLVNKTNAGVIASVYGPSTDSWTGRTIELYVGQTLFNGMPTPGLMVRIPSDSTAATAPPAPATPQPPAAAPGSAGSLADLENDVPW